MTTSRSNKITESLTAVTDLLAKISRENPNTSFQDDLLIAIASLRKIQSSSSDLTSVMNQTKDSTIQSYFSNTFSSPSHSPNIFALPSKLSNKKGLKRTLLRSSSMAVISSKDPSFLFSKPSKRKSLLSSKKSSSLADNFNHIKSKTADPLEIPKHAQVSNEGSSTSPIPFSPPLSPVFPSTTPPSHSSVPNGTMSQPLLSEIAPSESDPLSSITKSLNLNQIFQLPKLRLAFFEIVPSSSHLLDMFLAYPDYASLAPEVQMFLPFRGKTKSPPFDIQNDTHLLWPNTEIHYAHISCSIYHFLAAMLPPIDSIVTKNQTSNNPKAIVEYWIDKLKQWTFSPYKYTDIQLCGCLLVIFMESGYFSNSNPMPFSKTFNFLFTVYRLYNKVPYHNFVHVVDVTQALFTLVQASKPRIDSLLSPIEILTLYVSAICHDLGHPGLNNTYLSSIEHPLSVLYNGKHILENYHAAWAQFIFRNHPHLNFLQDMLSHDQLLSVYSSIIRHILATDMVSHFDLLTRFNNRFKSNSKDFCLSNENRSGKETAEDREFFSLMLLKAADLCNVSKPWIITLNWSKRLFDEWSIQSNCEKNNGVPVTDFMDYEKSNVSKINISFIKFCCIPLYQSIVQVLPSLQFTVDNMNSNLSAWERVKLTNEEVFAQLHSSSHSVNSSSQNQPTQTGVQSESQSFPSSSNTTSKTSSRSK